MRDTSYTKTNQTIVEHFKANNTVQLKAFYQFNYPKVEAFVLKNSGGKDEAKDVFQEAFIAVWHNIKCDKYTEAGEASINAYIFTIAKNKWMDVLRSKGFKKTIVSSSLNHFEVPAEESSEQHDDIFKNKRLQDTMQAFNNLGEACKNLLTKFYFEKKSMQLISEELDIDAASTRNKKYRCMQKLREIALNIDK